MGANGGGGGAAASQRRPGRGGLDSKRRQKGWSAGQRRRQQLAVEGSGGVPSSAAAGSVFIHEPGSLLAGAARRQLLRGLPERAGRARSMSAPCRGEPPPEPTISVLPRCRPLTSPVPIFSCKSSPTPHPPTALLDALPPRIHPRLSPPPPNVPPATPTVPCSLPTRWNPTWIVLVDILPLDEGHESPSPRHWTAPCGDQPGGHVRRPLSASARPPRWCHHSLPRSRRHRPLPRGGGRQSWGAP